MAENKEITLKVFPAKPEEKPSSTSSSSTDTKTKTPLLGNPTSLKGISAVDKKKTYKFTRHKKTLVAYGTIVGEASWSYKFTLDSLPNYTEFTALFDQYRIDRITFQAIPMQNTYAIPATQKDVGQLYAVVDNDDVSSATVADLSQYPNLKVVNFDERLRLTFKPRFASAAYSGAFTSYANTSGWIDCGSPSVEHYGVKLVIGQSNDVVPSWNIFYTVDLSFRAVR
jgi:hypothetical protein